MLSALLCAVVVASASESVESEGLGRTGSPPAALPVLRLAPRLRAGVAGLGVLGVQPNFDPAGGAGFALELGAVFADRISLFWHGELATTLFSLYGSNGLHADVALGDHFALGLGVNLTLWAQFAYPSLDPFARYSYFSGFTFPVRAHFTVPVRGATRERSGLTFTVLASPGVTLAPVVYAYDGIRPFNYSHGFAMTLAVAIGYLHW